MRSNKLITLGIAIFSLTLTSCLKPSKNSSHKNTNKSSSKKTSSLNGSSSEETSSFFSYSSLDNTGTVVGTSGGEVKGENNNITLDIPAGALDTDVTISVDYKDDKTEVSDKVSAGFLAGAEFYPSGTKFNKPVEVTMDLVSVPVNDEVSIFCYDEVNDIWDFVSTGSVNINQTVSFEVTHFSKYQALDITPAMLSKYFEIVKTALSEGLSDSWITETYRNYLIYDEHVMDYYQEFGGYYFEPCGMTISGSYETEDRDGNGDALIDTYGYENKKGEVYGYTKDASGVSSYQDYVDTRDNVTEKKEIINVLVSLYYEIITPQIELTATKTKVEKDESTTVTAYCHYRKTGNVIYPDFELPGYYLTVENNVHFSVNKEIIQTNFVGRASFVATALDDKGKDDIKVRFEHLGDDPTSAQENILLEIGSGYTIYGTITQEMSFDFTIITTSSLSVVQVGKLNVIFTYDFEGQINDEEGILSAALSYKNADMSITGTDCITRHPTAGTGGYSLFRQFVSKTPVPAAYSVLASKDANEVVSIPSAGDSFTIFKADLQGDFYSNQGEFRESMYFNFDIKNGSDLLLDFALTPGEATYTSNKNKDKIYAGLLVGEEHIAECGLEITITNIQEKTTQTITVE